MIGKYELPEILDKEKTNLEKPLHYLKNEKIEKCVLCGCDLLSGENYRCLCWKFYSSELDNCF